MEKINIIRSQESSDWTVNSSHVFYTLSYIVIYRYIWTPQYRRSRDGANGEIWQQRESHRFITFKKNYIIDFKMSAVLGVWMFYPQVDLNQKAVT